MLRKNKRGSVQDILFIAVILFVFAISVLIGFKIMAEINSNIQSSSIVEQYDTDDHAQTASSTLTSMYPGVIDNSFLFLTIGLVIITLIMAAMVRIHPMFMVLFFIGLVIIIFVTGALSNVYQEMAASSSLSTEADQLVFISHIMEYLPFIIGIFGFILMIVMYKLYKNAE